MSHRDRENPLAALHIAWCSRREEADALAEFFVRHVQPGYISHGEIQLGRAEDEHRWSRDLRERVAAEVRSKIPEPAQPPGGPRVLAASDGGELVAMALVTFHQDGGAPYGVLEDLVVHSARRRQGIGDAVLHWIEGEARAWGAARLFLESGIHNEAAHAFFERHGFRTCSITMMKALGG